MCHVTVLFFFFFFRDNQHDTLYLKLMWECERASSKFNVYTYVQVVRRRLHLETLGPRLEGVQYVVQGSS